MAAAGIVWPAGGSGWQPRPAGVVEGQGDLQGGACAGRAVQLESAAERLGPVPEPDQAGAGEIAYAQTRTELLEAITTILDAGSAAGDLRADVTAEDIAASLVGIFTVAGKPGQHPQASRLLNLLMDGLRPPAT